MKHPLHIIARGRLGKGRVMAILFDVRFSEQDSLDSSSLIFRAWYNFKGQVYEDNNTNQNFMVELKEEKASKYQVVLCLMSVYSS